MNGPGVLPLSVLAEAIRGFLNLPPRTLRILQRRYHGDSYPMIAREFEVTPQAVEKLFEVKVKTVNTSNFEGKTKRQGVHVGKTSTYKKAVVTIDTDPSSASYLTKGGKQTQSTRKFKTTIEEFGFGQ